MEVTRCGLGPQDVEADLAREQAERERPSAAPAEAAAAEAPGSSSGSGSGAPPGAVRATEWGAGGVPAAPASAWLDVQAVKDTLHLAQVLGEEMRQ
jgi:hypothetical protein